MLAILDVVFVVLDAYTWIVIASAVMSWLIAFNVVNMHNDVARNVWNFLVALTEPLLRPIRQMLPRTGGIDLSPVVLLLAIVLLERVLARYVAPYVF
jgi:YggT family protein